MVIAHKLQPRLETEIVHWVIAVNKVAISSQKSKDKSYNKSRKV
jgi:hypothetical protein